MDVTERVVVLDGSTVPDREVVGNKGASLARMHALGMPVPPAFVLPIDECRRFHAAGGKLDDELWAAVLTGIARLEHETARRFGDPQVPLLVSVRSGAAVSMPGMMDTILNLGMTDAVEDGLARLAGDAGFAGSTHARFIHEFGHTVLGADLLEAADEHDSPAAARRAVLDDTGEEVPRDPAEQLRAAIHAVFGSWSSRRAKAYRRHWGIPDDGGTAVIVQAMVFGNLEEASGTGVLFTRDPLSGANVPYGEWLPGGQGEDVVSGTHDCLPLSALRDELPDAHDRLLEAAAVLERENGDVQDIEFTVERGKLYLLQTRSAKRSPLAAIRTAVDLAEEGAIDRRRALSRVSVEQVQTVLAPRLAEATAAAAEVVARGTPACPGIAAGVAIQDAAAAERYDGESVLVRPTTSPEDVAAMIAARAVVTERGGSTSHAAVVTRALGRPSVVGVGDGQTDPFVGQEVTVDGTAGIVYAGRLPTVESRLEDVPGLAVLVGWAEELSPVAVRDDAPEVVDLDEADDLVDADGAPRVDLIHARLDGALAARGLVLTTAQGAEAVVTAGVRVVVRRADQPAAALLIRLAQAATPRERT